MLIIFVMFCYQRILATNIHASTEKSYPDENWCYLKTVYLMSFIIV